MALVYYHQKSANTSLTCKTMYETTYKFFVSPHSVEGRQSYCHLSETRLPRMEVPSLRFV